MIPISTEQFCEYIVGFHRSSRSKKIIVLYAYRFLKYRYNYTPPADIEERVRRAAEECGLELCADWKSTRLSVGVSGENAVADGDLRIKAKV